MKTRKRYEWKICRAYMESRDRMKEKAKRESKAKTNVYIPSRAADVRYV